MIIVLFVSGSPLLVLVSDVSLYHRCVFLGFLADRKDGRQCVSLLLERLPLLSLLPEPLHKGNVYLLARRLIALSPNDLQLVEQLLPAQPRLLQICAPPGLQPPPNVQLKGDPAEARQSRQGSAADDGYEQLNFLGGGQHVGLVVAQYSEDEEDRCGEQVRQHADIVQRALVGLAEHHPQQQQRLDAGCEKGEPGALVEEGIAEEERLKEHEGEIERDVKPAAEGQSLKRVVFIICDQGHPPLVEEDQAGCDHEEEEQGLD